MSKSKTSAILPFKKNESLDQRFAKLKLSLSDNK